jgi:hypothetical protein
MAETVCKSVNLLAAQCFFLGILIGGLACWKLRDQGHVGNFWSSDVSLVLRSQSTSTTTELTTATAKKCWESYKRNIDAAKATLFVPGKTVMMSAPSVRIMCSLLTPESRVLEWGSGGSTLFFSQFVKSWDTIEHNAAWVPKMQEYTKKLANVQVHSAKHTWNGISNNGDGGYKDFKDYVNLPTHNGFTSDGHKKFDVIIIDGRARVDCARIVLKHHLLAQTGVVALHDWERWFYKEVLDSYDIIKEDLSGKTQNLGILVPKGRDGSGSSKGDSTTKGT